MPRTLMGTSTPALLVLADGSVFEGRAIGAHGSAVGEVVFNTSMTGYQEILTDPSYARQIVTLTYPHIGNTGTNSEDEECADIWAAGLVIRDLPLLASSFRKEQSLQDYLRERNVVGIADIDTRRLTRLLRDKGAQSGCIVAGESVNKESDREAALAKAKEFAGLKGMDLAKVVSTKSAYPFNEGTWELGSGHKPAPEQPFKVVAYDFGVKRNILRMLVDRGCDVTVVPAQTPAAEALAMNPDGIFLSNGPGDPEPCDYAIEAIKTFIDKGIPTYGICLGHQLLGLAVGGRTLKMKFGHHGGNHPVQDLATSKVMITAQNHGFAVDADSLPDNVEVTHKSLFDGTLQGISLKDKPVYSFQGHPEASPGPHDMAPLFDRFIELMKAER
ncbi:glutamine-hydrolyzing carbamoyl-phosphate synthase small subunit [Microbulbifer hainanensis]|uniref:glutamine-hydrolyzing carbamoyl-phosphate synthase small subunit n=1 Tax=Microbulbifer hainanensis TaxID=2735675 RepID=UPI001D024F13|nr:glutamine-hydrolyzing carbamoyl-phosphate synthase small subunit [Microbulbifer hainanensis]